VRHGLSNLCVIIDANDLQAMDRLDAVLTLPGRRDDLRLKTQAFGCVVDECDGHDPDRIAAGLDAWAADGAGPRAPQVLIARTIKGYGLICMENVPKYHFRLPTPEELAQGKRYE
jgi:transketolase